MNEASCIKSFEFSNTVDTRYIRTTPCTVDFYCSVLVTVRLSKKRHVKGKRCRALLLCTAATSVKFKHNFIVLKYFFVLFAVSIIKFVHTQSYHRRVLFAKEQAAIAENIKCKGSFSCLPEGIIVCMYGN